MLLTPPRQVYRPGIGSLDCKKSFTFSHVYRPTLLEEDPMAAKRGV
jgi:hypothetical protein